MIYHYKPMVYNFLIRLILQIVTSSEVRYIGKSDMIIFKNVNLNDGEIKKVE